MSHIVHIKTEVRDFSAVGLACNRMKIDAPVNGTFQLYNSEVTGCGIQLREWNYPVVCLLRTGEIKFDNYEGRWGDPKRLDEFLQSYAVEKAKIEARKNGHSVAEKQLEDGSIKLTVSIGGVA